ncbi:hypothetical protein KSS87_022678 [Heliosperma pusillum]|nr:hypothetical protein KSS87_022678 [Heliosperma pusillum]
MVRPPIESNNVIKFLCSYGGKILPRYPDGKLRYQGGHTRVLSVARSISYPELLLKMGELCGTEVRIRCQLPTEDLDALITIKSNEDLENMIEEYDNITTPSSMKVRAFLLPRKSSAESPNSLSPNSLSPSSSFNSSPRFTPPPPPSLVAVPVNYAKIPARNTAVVPRSSGLCRIVVVVVKVNDTVYGAALILFAEDFYFFDAAFFSRYIDILLHATYNLLSRIRSFYFVSNVMDLVFFMSFMFSIKTESGSQDVRRRLDENGPMLSSTVCGAETSDAIFYCRLRRERVKQLLKAAVGSRGMEKLMTMPQKSTRRDARRLEKAEKAALIEKVELKKYEYSLISCLDYDMTCTGLYTELQRIEEELI